MSVCPNVCLSLCHSVTLSLSLSLSWFRVPNGKNLEKPFRKPRQQSRRNDGKTKDMTLICKHTTFKHKSLESHNRKAKNEKSRKIYETTNEPLHGPTPKREKKQNPRGRTTESEKNGGQREDAAFQEEPPAATRGQEQKPNPSPTRGQAQGKPSTTAEADRRSPEARARSQKQTAKRAERPKP